MAPERGVTVATKVTDIGLTRDQWHRYFWQGKGPMAGVTSIVKIQEAIGGDGLLAWAAGQAADYVIGQLGDGLEAWTGGVGTLPPTARDILRLTAIAQKDEPSRLGTAVHEQVRRILHGEQITPDPETVYHLAHFAAFMGKEKPEVFFAEEMIANLKLGYGGAFDFIGQIRGELALVDVKTGTLRKTHKLQLAGYQDAEFIGRSGSAETVPMPKVERAYVLLLRADGYDLVDQTPTAGDRAHFAFLAGVHQKLKTWTKAEEAA